MPLSNPQPNLRFTVPQPSTMPLQTAPPPPTPDDTSSPGESSAPTIADPPRQSSSVESTSKSPILDDTLTREGSPEDPNRAPPTTDEEKGKDVESGDDSRIDELELDESPTFTKDFWIIPMPRRLRYDPKKPFHFGMTLNAAFGFASTFIVANLYYCQPLLVQLSESFNVSYGQVSKIPTLVQAGYALGLLFITPLGDLVRRRPLILSLIILGTLLTIPLTLTRSLPIFSAFTFLTGIVSVTPMVLLPLAADLAPPHHRASAIAVVLSGLLLGILAARVLAGVVAQYTPWRVVYDLAIGVQAAVLVLCWLLVPDYPAAKGNRGMSYGGILWSMGRYAVKEPLVVQAALVNIGSSACFTNFWVTLTFLLAGEPYRYSTLAIGLFGLVGMLGVALGPPIGRLIDHLNPWHAALISITLLTAFQTVQVAAGGVHVAAVVVTAFALDVFRGMLQVSLTTGVFSIAPSARSRLNAILVLSIFIGQVIGTAVGAHVFVRYGWRASALLSLGWYVWQICVMLARGPFCERGRWVGWGGRGVGEGWRGRGKEGVGKGEGGKEGVEVGVGVEKVHEGETKMEKESEESKKEKEGV